MNCEAGLLLNCENPTPGSHFSGESTHEQQMTLPVVCAYSVDGYPFDLTRNMFVVDYWILVESLDFLR